MNAQKPKFHQIVEADSLHLISYLDNSGEGGGMVDPEAIDFSLLNYLLFNKINAHRKKKRLPLLEYDSTLDKMAHYNVHYSSSSSYKYKRKGKHYFSRDVKKARRFIRLPYGICKAAFSERYAMDYRSGSTYFFYEETQELVYGRGADVDSNFVPKPVKHFTYDELSQTIFEDLLRSNKQEINSKVLVKMSLQSAYVKRTVKPHKIPKIRASLVMAAPRLQGL